MQHNFYTIKNYSTKKYVWCSKLWAVYFPFNNWKLEPEVNGIAYDVYSYNINTCMAYLILDLYVYVPLKPDRTGHCVTTGRWPPERLLFFVIKYYKIF